MSVLQQSPVLPREQRFLLQNVIWQGYLQFLDAVGDRPVRLTYDRGNLELMSPSYRRATYASLLGRFVEAVTEELNIPMKSGRCTTFRRRDLDRDLEPDHCYYVQHVAQLRGRTEIDLTRDPPPDLAIEVDVTRSSLDRMSIYAALGIPEVWRFDGEALEVHRLAPDGAYGLAEQSGAFTFLPIAELVVFLRDCEDTNDTSLFRSFRSWVRSDIVPRWEGGPRPS